MWICKLDGGGWGYDRGGDQGGDEDVVGRVKHGREGGKLIKLRKEKTRVGRRRKGR